MVANHTKSLTNLIYTDHQTVSPKYVPVKQEPSESSNEHTGNKIGSHFSENLKHLGNKKPEAAQKIDHNNPRVAVLSSLVENHGMTKQTSKDSAIKVAVGKDQASEKSSG